jgi:hypothetical protein
MTATWLRCRPHRLLAAGAACAWLLAIAPAQAQQADTRETRARADCLAGRFQAGVDLLAQLFAETGNANYIYNQGRCYEQNGRQNEAILRFREYLRTAKNLSAGERGEVNGHVAECQAELDKRLAPPPPAPSPPPVPQVGDDTGPNQGGDVVATQSGSSEGGGRLRIAGIVTGAVGAAAVVTGVIFGVMAQSIANEVTADDVHHTYDRSKDDRGKLFETLQWVSYGLGAAGIVTGGVLYYLGYRAPASSSVSLLPVLLPGGTGAVVQGRF